MFMDRNRKATSSNITDYNNAVQDEAANGASRIRPFAGSFRALISTRQVDARDNTATNNHIVKNPDISIYNYANHPDVPIYWLAGKKIADNTADFYDGRLGQ